MNIYRNLLAWLVLVWQAAYLHHVWHSLPATLPIHFNLSGTPNRFALRSAVWVMIGVCALLLIFLSLIEKSPYSFNLPNPVGALGRHREEALARKLMGWLRLEIAILFAFLLWWIVHVAQHKTNGPGMWLTLISTGIIVFTVAYFLVRMKKPTNSF